MLIVDLSFANKTVLIIGGGRAAYMKANKFLWEAGKVVVAAKEFSEEFQALEKAGKVTLTQLEVDEDLAPLVKLIRGSHVVCVATDDWRLNRQVTSLAREQEILAYSVDDPEASDFTMLATTRIGDVEIGVSTKGKSPAMARLLRDRIERLITKEDVLQVELQHHARKLAKDHVSNEETRRETLYKIISNHEIRRALKENKIQHAQQLVDQIIRGSSENGAPV